MIQSMRDVFVITFIIVTIMLVNTVFAIDSTAATVPPADAAQLHSALIALLTVGSHMLLRIILKKLPVYKRAEWQRVLWKAAEIVFGSGVVLENNKDVSDVARILVKQGIISNVTTLDESIKMQNAVNSAKKKFGVSIDLGGHYKQ